MSRRIAVQLALVVAVLAVLGVVGAFVWHWIWTPVHGVVVSHQWTPTDALGLQQEFSATGWYVVVALVAGLVGGLAAGLIGWRAPVLTLVAVVVGSVLATWLMLTLGGALGPTDPDTLAKTAADGTKLPSALQVSGHSPWAAFPSGALVGMLVVFIGLSSRSPEQVGAGR